MSSTAARSSTIRRPAILTWQGVDVPRLESVRLVMLEGRLRASGRIIAAADPGRGIEAYNASFEGTIERSEATGRLLLRTITADEERQISLNRTEDDVWLIQSGQDAERTEFGGAIDVDVANAVIFNALPIRRLRLHREPAEHEMAVVYVSLPDLSVRLVRQTYRTVSITPDGAVINISRDDLDADLVVDRDGLVIDYPGLARRV